MFAPSEKSPSLLGSRALSSAWPVMEELPLHPKIRSGIRRASGAEPGPMCSRCTSADESLEYSPRNVLPSAPTPYPAAVPATCVPCPDSLQSMGLLSGAGALYPL